MTLPAPPAVGRTADGREMGWHADPWHRHQLRFHDGTQWTEHVADGGLPSLDSGPVADLPRSRPAPARDTPPGDGEGPRVVDAGRGHETLDDELLLLDARGDDDPRGRVERGRAARSRRALRGPGDRVVGWVDRPRPSRLRRAVDLLVADPSDAPTRLEVVGVDGGAALTLSRPGRRIAPVVDLTGPGGLRATIRAASVRQGLRAEVRTGDAVVGWLQQVGSGRTDLQVVDAGGARLARLSAVWDVPGQRRHLPPGVLLVDRRPADDRPLERPRATVLLGALLAGDLLLPPPPPTR